MSRFHRSLSPAALVIAALALFIAVSAGTSYAALTIGTNQLRKNAVTSVKIKDGTIRTRDLSAATIAELRGGGVPAAATGASETAGPSGPQGPQGEAGREGAAGPAGATGAAGPQGPAGPAGAEGPAGPAGPAGPEGRQGPAGPAGADGSARAYALVTPFGLSGTNKGVAAMSRPATGHSCLTLDPALGIDVSRIAVVVSVEYSLSTATNVAVQWRSAATGCPAGTIEVLTFRVNADGGYDPFDGVAFTVLVP